MKQSMMFIFSLLMCAVVFTTTACSPAEEENSKQETEKSQVGIDEMMDEFLEAKGWEGEFNNLGKKNEFFVSMGATDIPLPPGHPHYEGARFLAYKEVLAEVRSDLAKVMCYSLEERTAKESKEVTVDSRFGEMEMSFNILEDDNTRFESVAKSETPRMVAEPYMTYLFETEKEVGVIAIWSQKAADQIESGRPVTITFNNVRTKENRAVVKSVVAKINSSLQDKGLVIASNAELVGENKIKCTLRGMNKWFLGTLRDEIPNFPLAITVGENNILATF